MIGVFDLRLLLETEDGNMVLSARDQWTSTHT